jgi:hypothetical protein
LEEEYPPVSHTTGSSAVVRTTRRRPRTPKLVDIDLRAGDIPFEEYVAQTAPQSQIEKVLVIAGWYSNYANVKEITVDHVYSGFKAMKWTDVPNDFRVPLADLARKKEFLTKGDRRSWVLNHLGEAELQKMKERAASTAEA